MNNYLILLTILNLKIMADINVEIPGLEDFKGTVDKSSREFDSIKQNLVQHLNGLRNGEWETEGARNFDTVFKESEKDIANLVDIMQRFVSLLNKKIEEARGVETHKLSM